MPVRLNSTGGGSVTLDVPATAGTFTINLPAASGSIVAADGSGNVGIGTSSPLERLQVVGRIRIGPQNNTGGDAGIDFLDSSNTGGFSLRWLDSGGYVANLTQLSSANAIAANAMLMNNSGGYRWSTNGAERMRIDGSGNVGIGTSSPATRLDISGGTTTLRGPALFNTSSTSGTNSSAYIRAANSFSSSTTPDYAWWYDDQTGLFHPAIATIGFTTGGVERMRIDGAGNVGIGTSSAGNRLTVAGSGQFTGTISQNSTGTHIWYQSNLSYLGAWGPNSSTNGTLVFYSARSDGSNGLERARINADGDVLIGTTTPSGKLTVNGAVILTNQSFAFYAQSSNNTLTGYAGGQTVANSIWANDRISAGEFNARSDGRLKKDVTPIPASDAWQFIQNVTAVHYKWINGSDDGHKFGFIAQDVVKAGFPNLVGQYPDSNVQEVTDADGFTSPAGVMLSVNYDQIVPVLASALRDALSRIETLEARLAAVEAR